MNNKPFRNARLTISFLFACLSSTSISAAPDMDQIAVVVNNSAIMLSDVENRVHTLPASPADSDQTLRQQAVDDLIMEQLQLQQASKQGISTHSPQQAIATLRNQQIKGNVKIEEKEIDDLIASQSEDLTKGERYNLQHILIAAPDKASIAQINNARERAGQIHRRLQDGEDFTRIAQTESDSYAAKSGGNLGWQTAEKLPESFKSTLALMETDDISAVIRDSSGFHILKLLAREGGKRKLATTTRTRHILISTNKLPDGEARQKITTIYQQLLNGTSFAKLAAQFSDDPGSEVKGGDLGWINPGQTVEPFEATMNQTAVNAISQPFKTQFGWHILQVLDRKQDDRTEESLRNKARAYLAERKAEEYYQAWLQTLRREAFIEYRIPLNESGLQLK